MTIKPIIVNTPENLIQSDAQDWASIFNSILGDISGVLAYGEKLNLSIKNANTVTLLDGVYSMQGHVITVEKGGTYDLAIESGTIGIKRIDAVVVEYKKSVDSTLNDEFSFKVLKGTPTPTNVGGAVPPTLIKQDLLEGGVLRQDLLYLVNIVDDQIIDFVDSNEFIPTFEDLKYLKGMDLGGEIVSY